MSKHYSIELDCPPGLPRPWDLVPRILEGTGVELRVKKGAFFGHAEYHIPDDQVEAYEASLPLIKERIIALYNRGTIRYATWGAYREQA